MEIHALWRGLFRRPYDMSFDAANKVHLDPAMPAFLDAPRNRFTNY